jgi:hypothetical protein
MQIATLLPKEVLAGLPDDQHFRAYNRALAMNLVELFDEDIESTTLTFAQRMELYKITAKFGDMEPKQSTTMPGTGFSIKIVLGDEEMTISSPGNTYDAVEAEQTLRSSASSEVTDAEMEDVPINVSSYDPIELAPPLHCLSVFPPKDTTFALSLAEYKPH